MDLQAYVAQQAPNAQINSKYLAQTLSIPSTQLAHERETLISQIESLSTAESECTRKHTQGFNPVQQTMQMIRDLSRELAQSSEQAVESTLSVLKPSETPYEALRTLLDDDLTVYEQVDLLHELVCMPAVIKDCVMEGDFNKAFELTQLVGRLQVRYPNSELVSSIHEQVQTSMDGLRSTLLKSLSESSKLNLLTKAVTHLRRLEVANLQSKYVDARWQFMLNTLQSIPKQLKTTQPFAYLKRVIEIYREHVFATINAVRTIFPPEDMENNNSMDLNSLSQFSRTAISHLLQILVENSGKVVDQIERSSLWLQLAFCSSSLGRVQCDFWDLLGPQILTNEEWVEAQTHQRDMAAKVKR